MEKGTVTHSSILAWRNPWTEDLWQATVHGVAESDTNEQLSLLHLWEVLLYRLGKMKLVLGSQPCPLYPMFLDLFILADGSSPLPQEH